MKKITKLIALLLCLSLLFGTLGAGAASADFDVVGTWSAKFDLMKVMAASSPEATAMFGEGPINMEILLTFAADGTVTADANLDEAIPALKAGLTDYLTQMAEEYGMSLETLESLMGGSIDELLDEQLDPEALKEAFASEDLNGTYTVEGDRVIINGKADNYLTIKGDTLVAELPDLGELVFTRTDGERRTTEPAAPAAPADGSVAGNWAAELSLTDLLAGFGHSYSEFDDFDEYDYYYHVYLLLGEDGSFRGYTDLSAVLCDFRADAAKVLGDADDAAITEKYDLAKAVETVNGYLGAKRYSLSDGKVLPDGSAENALRLEDGKLIEDFGGVYDPVEFVRIPEIAGTWRARMNLQNWLVSFGEDELAEYVGADEAFDFVLNLDPFGYYTAYTRAAEAFPTIQKALVDYALATESEEDIKALEEDYGLTLEEIIAQEYSAEYLNELMFYEADSGEDLAGTYERKDDLLILDGDEETPFRLDGGTMSTQFGDYGEAVFEQIPGVAGTWRGTMDLARVMALGGGEMAEVIGDLSCEVEAVYTFTEDGKYSCRVNFDATMEDLKPLFTAIFNYVLAQQGMTVEQFEELSGMTLDELIEQTYTPEAIEEMMGSSTEGSYSMIGTLFFMDGNFDTACSWNGRDVLVQTLEGYGDFVLTRIG